MPDMTGSLLLNRTVRIVWPTLTEDEYGEEVADYEKPLHSVTARGRLSNPRSQDGEWWDLDTGKLLLEPRAFKNLPEGAENPRYEIEPDPLSDNPYWYETGKAIAGIDTTGSITHYAVRVTRAR